MAKAFITIRADQKHLEPDLQATKSAFNRTFDGIIAKAYEFRGAIAAAVGALKGLQGVLSAIRLAGQFEQTTIAFETMLGSAEETKDTMADLTEFAAKTPFEMPGILQAARGLIQFGERGDELMETLRFLGDASAATSTDFGFLALVFNQVRGVGKLLTQDFRQLSTRGIISLQDIADHFKVTTQEAQAMLSGGKVTFEEFRKMMKGLSEEGGRFNNMMEKQSVSLLGLWSTLTDQWNILKRQMGTPIADALKPMLKVSIKLLEMFGEVTSALMEMDLILPSIKVSFELIYAVVDTIVDGINLMTEAIKNFGTQAGLAVGAVSAIAWAAGATTLGPAGLAVGGGLVAGDLVIDMVEARKGIQKEAGLIGQIIEDMTGKKFIWDPFGEIRMQGLDAAGAVEGVGGGFLELLATTQKFYEVNAKGAAQLLKDGTVTKETLDAMTSALADLEEIGITPDFKAPIDPMEKYGEALDRIKESGLGATKGGAQMVENIKEQMKAMSGFTRAMKSAEDQLKVLQGYSAQDMAVQAIADAGAKTKEGLAETKKEVEALREIYEKVNKLQERKSLKDEGVALSKSLMTPLEKFREEAERIEKLRSAGVITAEIYDRALDGAAETLAEHQASLRDAQTAMHDIVLKATEGRMSITDMHDRIQDALIQNDKDDPQLEKLKEQIKLQHTGLKKQDETIKAIRGINPGAVLS